MSGYLTATVVLVPLSIYFIKRGDWRTRAFAYFVLAAYLLLTLIIVGMLGQAWYGNGINVLFSLLVLAILLLYLDPFQKSEKDSG